jgi:DsbC/DsbD-like thiol-disulfide interchange protein
MLYMEMTKRKNSRRGSRIKFAMRNYHPGSTLRGTIAFVLVLAGMAHSESTPIPHGTLDLIAETQWISPGRNFDLGFRFQLEKGWHIYWMNPGDSGEPPRIAWRLPAAVTAGPIEWPAPRRLGSGSIADFGYEDSVLLVVPMVAASNLSSQQPVAIVADVKVLVCSHEMCIPGKTQLAVTLPVKSQSPAPDASTADLFARTRKSWPQPFPLSWTITVADAKDSFVVTVKPPHSKKEVPITQAEFFPLAESQIANAAAQKLEAAASGFRMTLAKSDQLTTPIPRLKGLLVVSGEQAYLMDVPITRLDRE